MTEQEFIAKVVEVASVYHKVEKKWHKYDFRVKKKDIGPDDFLYKYWRTGGVGGGSCWDEEQSEYHAISGEPEPEFNDLDAVLEAICPNISFIKYKTLMKDAKIEEGTWTENEYYGNSTTYAYKAVRLGDLYAALVGKGLI